jgi:integrase
MARSIKLTDKTIAYLELPEDKTQDFIRDTKQAGFGIRISAKTKSFIYEGKVNGKSRRCTIGHFPEWGTEKARKEAKRLAVEMDQGTDPNRIKKDKKQTSIKLGKALDDYLSTNNQLAERTRLDYKQVIHRYAADWLTHGLFEITPEMIEKKHAQVSKKSHAQANLLMRYIRAVYNAHAGLARINGMTVPTNPVEILNLKKQWNKIKARNFAVSPEKLAIFWDALTDAERTDRKKAVLYKVLLLTGLRIKEARELKWLNVSLLDRSILFYDTKNHLNHALPMGNHLFEIFSAIPQNSEYVLSNDNGKIDNLSRFKKKIQTKTGIWVSPHDLRRTFASAAAGTIDGYLLKKLINHKNDADITLGYISKKISQLREPMQTVENKILAMAKPTSFNESLPLTLKPNHTINIIRAKD